MKKLVISESECIKHGLTVEEVLAILLFKSCDNVSLLAAKLVEKQVLVKDIIDKRYHVTQRWDDEVCSILLDSDKTKEEISRVEKLSIALQEVFPAGKKEGTIHYWRGNKREIGLRLKKFLALYNDNYTDEQIIKAASDYVQSFNGQYQYMRILKYFLWKDEKKEDEDGTSRVVSVSDLANYIENSGSTDLRDDWTSNLN